MSPGGLLVDVEGQQMSVTGEGVVTGGTGSFVSQVLVSNE